MARMRRGVDKTLEEAADAILAQSFLDDPRGKDLILTPSKQRLRRKRELLVPGGTPDASLRQGNYRRAYNSRQTHLNAREGHSPASRQTHTSQDDARPFVTVLDGMFG